MLAAPIAALWLVAGCAQAPASTSTRAMTQATTTTTTATTTTTTTPPAATAQPAEPLTWHLVIDASFVVVETVCPAVPLAPEMRAALAFLKSDDVVDGCRRLVFDLGQAADTLQERDAAVRIGPDAVMASPDVWLWRPRPARSGTLTIEVPEGWSAVVPFPVVDGDAGAASPSPRRGKPGDRGARSKVAHRVDASTWAFLSTAVFGKVPVRALESAGATFTVVTLPGELAMVRSDVDRWLSTAAEAVALGNRGRFPFPRVQVVVDPVWGSGVPFGMVERGGGPQAFLLLGGKARVGDVVDDWVAVHELSHLLLPPVGADDAWLGEGMASYHQNVLRARAGLLTPAQAWEELREGFSRGAQASSRGPFTLSLAEASGRMRAEGRYLQVYWGGAAVVLLLDVGLRQCAGVAVDDVLAAFRGEQPLVDVRRVPAREVVARAAAWAPACAHLQADVDAALKQPFPPVAPLLQQLGIGDGRLDDEAELAGIRRAITGNQPARDGVVARPAIR